MSPFLAMAESTATPGTGCDADIFDIRFDLPTLTAMSEIIDVSQRMTGAAGRFSLDRITLRGIAMHHSAGGDSLQPGATVEQELAHLEVIDRYHVQQGFGGIGYHAAVFPSGRMYRLGSWDAARAHVASRNHELLGIVAIGTFTARLPGAEQLGGLREAVRLLRAHAGRSLPVLGHSEWALPGQGTLCPGSLTGMTWEQEPAPPERAMQRFNGIATTLEHLDLPAGIRDGILAARKEFGLPAEATSVRIEVALVRGAFALGDGSYAGRVDQSYGARLGIIDARLMKDGTLRYDCPPGTTIERVGCLGYWR